MPTNRVLILVAVSACILTGVAAPVRAQSTADDRELASYRLTMAGLEKMIRVNRDLADELKKDPKYQQLMTTEAQIKALEDKDSRTDAEEKQLDDLKTRAEQMEDEQPGNDLLNDAKTIDEMAAKIKTFAPLSSALAKEGVAPRDYAMFTLSMLQAGMAAGMQKAGVLKQLPPGVNAENVKFVLDHQTEIQKLQQSFGGSDK
jgi:hypothetical protein